ncbi:SDR family oxidoreductase [uncultured Flavobacterium sp.]|uniref:SDR family oxidoreductase n=1 Tax=uncultured Flavobacterium sp. TaxID=165435 RepID=UPI0025EAD053|nr:SDR family oxidoreductase [uncultured Flavobacterium sp.]
MESFDGKIAVVTGGNSGIGYAAAKLLREKGAQVIITGRRKEAIEKAALELDAIGMIADQSNLKDINNLASAVHKQFGRIDMLLINAGITSVASIESTTEILFDQVMDVNFKGAFFTLSMFIPFLNDGASIVFLSSTSARISPPNASVYAASKAALNAVMKIAAIELASKKIRVNAVSPGPIATEIMDKLGLDKNMENQMVNSVPLMRFGKPLEVANLISYLLSDQTLFITGSEFLIDGGQSI